MAFQFTGSDDASTPVERRTERLEPFRDTASISLPVAVLIAALGWACNSPSSPSPSVPSESSPPPSPGPPSPTAIRYHVSGIVADETGSPIAGADVEVEYSRRGAFSSPPSVCSEGFCWIHTVTNSAGYYDVVFEPAKAPMDGVSAAALINSWRDGYQTDIQLVPTGTPDIVENLRLRRLRTINAGQSITVSIEPESALCSDREDWSLLTSRCENVQILVDKPGTLTIEARAVDAGGIIPVIFFATSGQYTTGQVPGPGTASVGVQAGERYRLFVGIPSGTAAHRFNVSTSLR